MQILLVVGLSSTASAEEPSPSPAPSEPKRALSSLPANQLPRHPLAANPPHHRIDFSDETFKFNLRVDLPIAAGAGVTWAILALLKNQLSSSCRWCDTSSGGRDGLNGFDRWARDGLKWSNTSLAGTLSDVTTFAIVPVFTLTMDLGLTGSHGRWRRWAMDLLMIADAAAISGGVDYIVKYAVSRQRPYVHYEVLSGVPFQTTTDDNASFFSGHTTFAFAVATAGGMVASLRHYRLAPLVWVVGVGLATFCGYLRIAADAHYLSDVIVGGVVGSAVGVTVPLMRWIRPLREQNISLSSQANSQGALFSVGGVF